MAIASLQLWEERYAVKLRVATDGSTGAGHGSERHLFWSGSRPKGAALMAPTLERWMASRLAEEVSILKERRKGREERDLLAGASVPEEGKRKQPSFGSSTPLHR